MEKISVKVVWTPPVSLNAPFKLCGNELIDSFSALVRRSGNHKLGVYAERLGVSLKTLKEVVKRYTGMSADKWKDALLLSDIKWYLVNTLYSMKEIAEIMHFSNEKNMRAYFSTRSLLSAARYRKSFRRIETTIFKNDNLP